MQFGIQMSTKIEQNISIWIETQGKVHVYTSVQTPQSSLNATKKKTVCVSVCVMCLFQSQSSED